MPNLDAVHGLDQCLAAPAWEECVAHAIASAVVDGGPGQTLFATGKWHSRKGKGPPSPLYSRCGQSCIAVVRAGAATVQQHLCTHMFAKCVRQVALHRFGLSSFPSCSGNVCCKVWVLVLHCVSHCRSPCKSCFAATAFMLQSKQFVHHGSRLATPAVGHASCDPTLFFNMGASCVQMGSRMHVGERLQMHVVCGG